MFFTCFWMQVIDDCNRCYCITVFERRRRLWLMMGWFLIGNYCAIMENRTFLRGVSVMQPEIKWIFHSMCMNIKLNLIKMSWQRKYKIYVKVFHVNSMIELFRKNIKWKCSYFNDEIEFYSYKLLWSYLCWDRSSLLCEKIFFTFLTDWYQWEALCRCIYKIIFQNIWEKISL